MRYVDSGVVVAAFASWHESHGVARVEIARRPGIAAHAMVEAYSVLTRLPAPHRAHPGIVARYLDKVFTETPLTLKGAAYRHLVVRELPGSGIAGGPSYDALIDRAGPVARQRALTRGDVLVELTPHVFAKRQMHAIREFIETKPFRRLDLELLAR